MFTRIAVAVLSIAMLAAPVAAQQGVTKTGGSPTLQEQRNAACVARNASEVDRLCRLIQEGRGLSPDNAKTACFKGKGFCP